MKLVDSTRRWYWIGYKRNETLFPLTFWCRIGYKRRAYVPPPYAQAASLLGPAAA